MIVTISFFRTALFVYILIFSYFQCTFNSFSLYLVSVQTWNLTQFSQSHHKLQNQKGVELNTKHEAWRSFYIIKLDFIFPRILFFFFIGLNLKFG